MSQNVSEFHPLCCQMNCKIINSIISHKIIPFDNKNTTKRVVSVVNLWSSWLGLFLSFLLNLFTFDAAGCYAQVHVGKFLFKSI